MAQISISILPRVEEWKEGCGVGVVVGGEVGGWVRGSHGEILVELSTVQVWGEFLTTRINLMFFFFWVTLRCAAVQQQFRNILNSRARRDGGGGAGSLWPSRTPADQPLVFSGHRGQVPHKHQIQIKYRLQTKCYTSRHRSGSVPPGGFQKVKCDEYEMFMQQ